jgi:hypothetical protein
LQWREEIQQLPQKNIIRFPETLAGNVEILYFSSSTLVLRFYSPRVTEVSLFFSYFDCEACEDET